MPIRTYHDVILAAGDVSQDTQGLHGFAIWVVSSPLGETEPEPRAVPDGFTRHLGQLDRRKLHADDIIEIGETLGDLMQGDAAYPPDYVSKYIESRLAWFTQQCGPGGPGSGGETGS